MGRWRRKFHMGWCWECRRHLHKDWLLWRQYRQRWQEGPVEAQWHYCCMMCYVCGLEVYTAKLCQEALFIRDHHDIHICIPHVAYASMVRGREPPSERPGAWPGFWAMMDQLETLSYPPSGDRSRSGSIEDRIDAFPWPEDLDPWHSQRDLDPWADSPSPIRTLSPCPS